MLEKTAKRSTGQSDGAWDPFGSLQTAYGPPGQKTDYFPPMTISKGLILANQGEFSCSAICARLARNPGCIGENVGLL